MDNILISLSSDDYTTSFYPSNTTAEFICDLTETYTLEGEYECAIVDFIYKKKTSVSKILYIFCDICIDSYIKETKLPLLRIIDTKRKESLFPIYVNVKSHQFNKIRVYITDQNLQANSVSNLSFFMCTLHLRKKVT